MFEAARDVFVVLAKNYPDDRQYQNLQAASHWNLGDSYKRVGRTEEGEAECRKAVEIWQSLGLWTGGPLGLPPQPAPKP